MKYAVYILTALLATAGVVLCVVELISFIKDEFDLVFDDYLKITLWRGIINYSILIFSDLMLAILSIIQLKKQTPRILMFFSGIIFFGFVHTVFTLQFSGFLLVAAGLLPAIYTFTKYGILTRNEPQKYLKSNGLMIAAGAVACISAVYSIFRIVYISIFYVNLGHDIPFAYYAGFIGIARITFIAIFCFLAKRGTSVLYRMFFFSLSIVSIFLIFEVSIYLSNPANLETFFLYMAGVVLSLALVILILIHTLKTRHDSLIPQNIATAAEQAEMLEV